MHSMTKVVILLVLFNAIEYSMSKHKCDDKNREKVETAEKCGGSKFGPIHNDTKTNGPMTEKECCQSYSYSCNGIKTVSNSSICETASQLRLV